jgi:protein-S-isoprenylcysteine O-methyltransferase Ste14
MQDILRDGYSIHESVEAYWRRGVTRLQNTRTRTFKLFPAAVVFYEALRRKGVLLIDLRFVPLLALGHYGHRLIGRYRTERAGGGAGFENLPDRLVQSGPYAFTRNPIYLADLLFSLGVALTFRSKVGWLLFLVNAIMLQQRVLEDEERLRRRFGFEYEYYSRRVKRWLPFVL